MTGTYDPILVTLSYVIATIASFVALDLANRVSSARNPSAYYWLSGGAIAMGCGIWSMHFIGMLAFRLPIQMAYDPWKTAASALIAVVVSGLALLVISRKTLTWRRLTVAGTVMGLGIAAMHYTGMAALMIDPGIDYTLLLFTASIIIAIAAAWAALWIAFQLRFDTDSDAVWKKLGSACVMGAAIAGMHYTGMAAATFASGTICTAPSEALNNNWLATVVAACSTLLLAATMLISIIDARLARHLRTVNLRLAESRAAAEASSRAKTDFLAQMSHELRTPLNAIIGFSQLIRDQMMGPIGGTYAVYAGDIHDSGQHLLNIINNILDFTKAEAGHLKLQEMPIDVREIIDRCMKVVAPQLEKNRITATIDVAADLPRLNADDLKLRQILINLLSNAAKFTPDGGRIAVKAVLEEDGALVLSIADTGIGMSPDQIPRAFEAFSQIDSSLSRKFEGTGLGLPLAKRLVELHGGSLTIESVRDSGTTVQIVFPRARIVGR
jgi:NO-binding membrane sensor protein with MHYT domain/anti-sigma regulatory factor (Ser/Thr protein kinase)